MSENIKVTILVEIDDKYIGETERKAEVIGSTDDLESFFRRVEESVAQLYRAVDKSLTQNDNDEE